MGAFGQIFLKKGLPVGGIPAGSSLFGTFLNILTAMADPMVLAGLGVYVASTFVWLMVLSKLRLSVAYPLISLSYPLVVVLSAVILGEKPVWLYAAAGLLFISGGVSLIGLGLGRAGKEQG